MYLAIKLSPEGLAELLQFITHELTPADLDAFTAVTYFTNEYRKEKDKKTPNKPDEFTRATVDKEIFFNQAKLMFLSSDITMNMFHNNETMSKDDTVEFIKRKQQNE